MAQDEGNEHFDIDNPPFPLSASDRRVLSTPDDEYRETTWEDLQKIIATNDLAALKRRPSDLRRYLLWSHRIKRSHGSITNYVLRERLHWIPAPISTSAPTGTSDSTSIPFVSPIPFTNPSDFAILRNDWPYGLSPGIVHLLVWSKTPIPVDESRGGDITPESRRLIEEFVAKTFVDDDEKGEKVTVDRSRVLWFKNWSALQSVRGVDHVHVLVKGFPEDVIERWCVRRDL